jgi:hypothetical protein
VDELHRARAEASFNGGTRGGQFGQWEQNVLPQTRAFVTTINLSF